MFSFKEVFFKVFFIIFIIVSLVFLASFPPFNITALPDFIHKQATSHATFGLDSNITAITPNGTDTFVIFKPLGLNFLISSFPMGSSSLDILITSLAMFLMRCSFSSSLSRRGEGILFFFAAI